MAHAHKFLFGVLAVVLLSGLSGCYYDVEAELYPISCDTTGYSALTYQNGIKALFDTQCATSGCHAAGSSNGALNSYSNIMPLVNNGKITQRVVVDRDMPPSGMPNCDRSKIDAWIKAGAPEN